MIRLGLDLTLRSGREAMVRLLVTAAAVAVGVALLLCVLAEFHAYRANAGQPCRSCTQGRQVVPVPLPKTGDLWNNSAAFYQGQTISRLDMAALGPGSPVPPGIAKLPTAGTYYASPALAALIKSVPAGELGDRFPGKMTGTIGQAALSGPGDLVIYIGYTTAQLNAIAGTTWVRSANTAPGQAVFQTSWMPIRQGWSAPATTRSPSTTVATTTPPASTSHGWRACKNESPVAGRFWTSAAAAASPSPGSWPPTGTT